MVGEVQNRAAKLIGASQNTRGWRKAANAKTSLDKWSPQVEMSNRMRYLFDVVPHAESIGLNGAIKSMEKQLESVRGKWEEAWRR